MLVQVILHLESKQCRLCHLLFCRTILLKTWRPLEPNWTRRGFEGLPSTTGRVLPQAAPLSAVNWMSLMVAPQGACSFVASEREETCIIP